MNANQSHETTMPAKLPGSDMRFAQKLESDDDDNFEGFCATDVEEYAAIYNIYIYLFLPEANIFHFKS